MRRSYASYYTLRSETHAARDVEHRENDGRPTASFRPSVDRLTPVVEHPQWALDDLIAELQGTVSRRTRRQELAEREYASQYDSAHLCPTGLRAPGWDGRMNEAHEFLTEVEASLHDAETRLAFAEDTRQWFTSHPTQWAHCTAHMLEWIRSGDLEPQRVDGDTSDRSAPRSRSAIDPRSIADLDHTQTNERSSLA